MVEFIENRGAVPVPADAAVLTLDWEQRSRSRQRAVLEDGRECGIVLAHGGCLRENDVLRAADGATAVVRNKAEAVVTAHAPDWAALTRAAYHLGNRHVALQLGEGWLRFQPDPVLEKMTADLGLSVMRESAAFIPEPGVGHHSHHHHADAAVAHDVPEHVHAHAE